MRSKKLNSSLPAMYSDLSQDSLLSENASQEGQTTANQQDRKEAYQAHLNELRGLRSYRLAMKGSNASSQYA